MDPTPPTPPPVSVTPPPVPPAVPAWFAAARAHGWGTPLTVLLDVLAPFGVLAAQALYAAQPLGGLFGRAPWDALGALAAALEQPGGADALRAALDADPSPRPPAQP